VAHVTVIGTGYLGATHAACMAEIGHDVLGMDVDERKIAALTAGAAPFYEPELDALLAKHVASGKLRFTTSYEEVAAFGGENRAETVHFVCVNTPQKKSEFAADLSQVYSVVEGLAPHLDVPALVVGKSTVPVGTAARIADRFAALATGLGPDQVVEVAWNPEFLRESHAVQDTLHPDRLVLGVASQRAEDALRAVFAPLAESGVPILVTDTATAQLVKHAANAFLSTKISFINAMAEVCEAAGGDVMQLAEALSLDPRIGGRFLVPGLGFGGGCLPKDIRAFMARAGELGVDQALTFLREVDAINMRRRTRMVDLAREQCDGSFLGKRVAVWGAAFKPNSDDVRDSPALNVAASIHLQGGQVAVFDPKANANAAALFPTLHYVDSAMAAADGAHVILHLTEWAEFRKIDPELVGRRAATKRIVDGRNALDAESWRAAGWTYRALGRPVA
jgi:UDPglucose 6-dehydrogenase